MKKKKKQKYLRVDPIKIDLLPRTRESTQKRKRKTTKKNKKDIIKKKDKSSPKSKKVKIKRVKGKKELNLTSNKKEIEENYKIPSYFNKISTKIKFTKLSAANGVKKSNRLIWEIMVHDRANRIPKISALF